MVPDYYFNFGSRIISFFTLSDVIWFHAYFRGFHRSDSDFTQVYQFFCLI